MERTDGGRRFSWQVMLITEPGGLGGGSLLCDSRVRAAACGVGDQRSPSALRIKLGILNKCAFCYEEAWSEKFFIHKGYKK